MLLQTCISNIPVRLLEFNDPKKEICPADPPPHSCRQVDGIWFHKFLDQDYVFGIETDNELYQNMGYNTITQITIKTLYR